MYPLTAAIIIETKELWDELHNSLQDLPVRVLLEMSEPGELSALLDKIERMRPEVVFLDAASLKDKQDAIIRGIRTTSATPTVLVLNRDAQPEVILNVMRAGASEYLYLPFADQMREALERIGIERKGTGSGPRHGGRTVGFLSAKGGCGATTIACHTAVELPHQSKGKVLLADLDFDAGIVGFLLKSKAPYSMSDAVRNTQRLDENYWKALVSNGLVSGLEIITAPPPSGRENVRSEQVRFVLSFVRTQYDWVVLDLGRSLNVWSMGALEELDRLFIVTTLEIPALHQAKVLVQKLLDSGYHRNRLFLLLNRAPKRFEITIEELENMLGLSVYSSIPNDYAALNESYTEGKLVSPQTNLGRHYTRLAMKIAGVEEPKAKKKFPFLG